MMSRRKIKSSGGTALAVGKIVEDTLLDKENKIARENGLEEAKGSSLVLGITEISLTRESFLSSVSFQNTTKMLINSSINGAKDKLVGLKENIIVGRLVPAGSGFKGSKKWEMIEAVGEIDEGGGED
jgi:DNA-directed RNA polymerase subunit beta'